MPRGAQRCALLAGCAHFCAQPLRVHTGVIAHEALERGLFRDELIAQALAALHQGHRGARCAHEGVVGAADRLIVGRAHQLSDVLQLAPARLVAFNSTRGPDRLVQCLGQRKLRELLGVERDELFPQRLARVHLSLALRLAGPLLVRLRCFVHRVPVDGARLRGAGAWTAIITIHRITPTGPAQRKPMNSPFSIDEARLRELAREVITHARSLGASDCVCEASESTGLSVTTRKMRVETIENTRDKALGITVYAGQRRGHSSTSDFSLAAIRQAVQVAYDIARHTAVDDAAGLPDEEELERNPRHLDLFHPWDLDSERAIALAQRAEEAAFAVSSQIVNSEGANVQSSCDQFVLANSRGFLAGYPQSRHAVSVTPIARGRGGMQRDDWYSSTRAPEDLALAPDIGRYAAQRALARLGARKLATRQCPVLLEAPVACGLLGNFVQAASGSALYRKASFLVDSLGQKIFPSHVTVREDPFIARGLGSGPFDEEGVRGRVRDIVASGVLEGYFLSCYSARKLGMKSTGNAGGSHNLELRSSLTRQTDDFEAMLRTLGTGLLVTELIGMGIDLVNGDYSRGASGFWVENGAIAYPVEEITIAGNLRAMFAGVAAIGADTVVRGSKISGSVLIDAMTVGGS